MSNGRRGAPPARVADMATFVVALGITPDDYYAMTVAEHQAITAEHNRRQRRR